MRRAIFGVAIPALLISTSIGSPPMASSAWSKARSIEDTSDTSISTAGGTTRRTTSQASASPDLTRRRLGLSRRTVNRVALSRQLRGERIESIDSPCRDNNSRAGSREDLGEVVPKAITSMCTSWSTMCSRACRFSMDEDGLASGEAASAAPSKDAAAAATEDLAAGLEMPVMSGGNDAADAAAGGGGTKKKKKKQKKKKEAP